MTDDVRTGVPEQMQGTPEGQRMLQLLWDPPGPAGRGPRPKLALGTVVEAGVAIADAEGLEALSMRKVANRLGVGVMSLYTYVPGRSELLELMIDHVYGELPKAEPSAPWRDQVLSLSRDHVGLLGRHPWILDTSLWRLPMGPNVLDADEELNRALAAAGLAPSEIVGVKNLIQWSVHGVARTDIQDREVTRRTGISTEAYWESRNSFWFTYFEAARFPTMAWIHENGGFDDALAQTFDFAFERVLDGIQLLVDRTPAAVTARPGPSCDDAAT